MCVWVVSEHELAHSTQHTTHSTQHTAHNTQHTAHNTQHTAHRAHLVHHTVSSGVGVCVDLAHLGLKHLAWDGEGGGVAQEKEVSSSSCTALAAHARASLTLSEAVASVSAELQKSRCHSLQRPAGHSAGGIHDAAACRVSCVLAADTNVRVGTDLLCNNT